LRTKTLRWGVFFFISFLSVFLIGLFSLFIGSEGFSVKEFMVSITEGKASIIYNIIFELRLPRILLGFFVGGALSICGVILQGLFRNPLVEPYTLGISGGAALGVCLAIVFHLQKTLGEFFLPLFGFSGALGVILLVYFLSTKGGILRIQGLLLTGVMISFFSSSLIMLIMAVSRAEDLRGILFWIMGSLEASDWFFVKLMGLFSILGLFISYFFALDLNALSLGEEEALHLGVDVEKTKRLLFLFASLLTGLCVSCAGIIGFVGLVIPHFIRMLFGGDHRVLLAGSFFCGAGFLMLCDALARTVISPLELPVGVITGIIGGALFIYALGKKEVSL